MKTEIKAYGRVHEVELRQKRGDWNMKAWDGTLEAHVEWVANGYDEAATFLISWDEDNGINVRGGRGANQIAKGTKKALVKRMIEFVEENEIEIKNEILL